MIQISLIIPLYNKEKTIASTLYSVLKQKELPDEIIIINDGSTDKSVTIVQQFDNSNIKLINQENRGVSAARNRGIAEAKYDLIAFLDADDEWLPDYITTIKKLVYNYTDAIGYGTAYLCKSASGITNNIKLRKLHFQSDTGIIDNYFEVSNHSDPPIWTSAVCIRKKVLHAVGGFPVGVKAGEDLLTWARIALKGKFAYSRTPLVIYNQRTFNDLPGSPAASPSVNDIVGAGLLSIYRQAKKNNKKDIKKYISRWHKMRATLFLIEGQEWQAIKEIVKSLSFDIFNIKAGVLLLLLPLSSRYRFIVLFSNKTKQVNISK